MVVEKMWTQIALLTCSFFIVSNGFEAMFSGFNIVGAFISNSKFCEYRCGINEDSVTCGPECDVGQSRAAAAAFIDNEFGVVCINQNCTIFMGKKTTNAMLNGKEQGEVRDIFIFYSNRSINEFRKGIADAFERFKHLSHPVTVAAGLSQNKEATTEKLNIELLSDSSKNEKSSSKPLKKENNESDNKKNVKDEISSSLDEMTSDHIQMKTAINSNNTVLNKNSDSGKDNNGSINATQMDDEKKNEGAVKGVAESDKIKSKFGIHEREDKNKETSSRKNENTTNFRSSSKSMGDKVFTDLYRDVNDEENKVKVKSGGMGLKITDEITVKKPNNKNIKINGSSKGVKAGNTDSKNNDQTLNKPNPNNKKINASSNEVPAGITDIKNSDQTLNKQIPNNKNINDSSNGVQAGITDIKNDDQTLNNQNPNNLKITEGNYGALPGITGTTNIDQTLNNQNANNININAGSNGILPGITDLDNIVKETINKPNNANVASVSVNENSKGIKTVNKLIMYGNKTLHNETETSDDGKGNKTDSTDDNGALKSNDLGNNAGIDNETALNKKTDEYKGTIVRKKNLTTTSHVIKYGNETLHNQTVTFKDGKLKGTKCNKKQNQSDETKKGRNDSKNIAGNENGTALPQEMDSEKKNQSGNLNLNNKQMYKQIGKPGIDNDNDSKYGDSGSKESRNDLKNATGIKIGTTLPSENKNQGGKLNHKFNKESYKQKEKPTIDNDNDSNYGDNEGKKNANSSKDISVNKSKDDAENENKENLSLENNFGEDNKRPAIKQDGNAKKAENLAASKNGLKKVDATNLYGKNINVMIRSGKQETVNVIEKLNKNVKKPIKNGYKKERNIENVKKVNYKRRNSLFSKIYEIIY